VTVRRRCAKKPSPLDGGGLGGGDAFTNASWEMKKNPAAGATGRARSLRQNMTEAERRLRQKLRSHQVWECKFRRQVPIGRYVADFACHEARLVVEIDGGQHDRSSPAETERSRFLQNEGYRVLRFWNNEVIANLNGVLQTIAQQLSGATPTQTLPHQGGGLV
jgi:very-short-patch-repair endonuclease